MEGSFPENWNCLGFVLVSFSFYDSNTIFSPFSQTSLDCQFYAETPFNCIHIKVFSWTFLLIALRRFTNRAQDAMDAGMKSAQKAATSAVADAAAREVEKQISAGFGQLMGKRK